MTDAPRKISKRQLLFLDEMAMWHRRKALKPNPIAIRRMHWRFAGALEKAVRENILK